MMKMRLSGFVVGGIALLLTGCAEGSFRNRTTLNLTRVDGQPLPVTLPSGTGSVQALSGSLIGSRFDVGCTWVLSFSDGSNPTGDLPDCVIDATLTNTLDLDLGGPPLPSGTHSYHFGVS